MEPTTWELVKAFGVDLAFTLLALLFLVGATTLVHFLCLALLKLVDLPRLPMLARWLEYSLLALAAILFFAIAARGTFKLLPHLLNLDR